ncbi:MAG: Crp/Fnr family transcriptional regulator [Chloroflexota bacterium]
MINKTLDLNHLKQLKTQLTLWASLDEDEWRELSQIFHTARARPKTAVSHPGDQASNLIFVCKGLLRFYYLSESGKETNKAFVAENEFAGPLASAQLGLPLYFGIEALEETTMLVAPFEAFTALYDQAPAFERLGRKLAELLLIRKELRMRSMLEQTATERYLDFVKKNPSLIERIPQYHLATYLGITEVSLSRLKREITPNIII